MNASDYASTPEEDDKWEEIARINNGPGTIRHAEYLRERERSRREAYARQREQDLEWERMDLARRRRLASYY